MKNFMKQQRDGYKAFDNYIEREKFSSGRGEIMGKIMNLTPSGYNTTSPGRKSGFT